MLWLADEVDTALKSYRAEHGIDSKWEARERVVVALTGGPGRDARRAARIAARSAGGELHAVHVTSQDGLADAHPELIDAQRRLLETLGGEYHHVVGEDVPRTLVEFARSLNATQLVLGVSRRGRLAAAFTGPESARRSSGNPETSTCTSSPITPREGGWCCRTLGERSHGAGARPG